MIIKAPSCCNNPSVVGTVATADSNLTPLAIGGCKFYGNLFSTEGIKFVGFWRQGRQSFVPESRIVWLDKIKEESEEKVKELEYEH